MRNVLIDITRLLDRKLQGRLPTGVDRVSLEYLRYFAHRSTALVRYAGRWIELPPHDTERLYQLLLTPDGCVVNQIRWLVGKAAWRSLDQRFLKPRFLFNTGHSGLEIPQYTQRLRGSALKPIFLVHDLIPIMYPEYCRPGEADKHRLRMKTMLDMGCGVIANSRHTLNELNAYADSNRMSMPPAVAALLAPAPLPPADAAAPIAEPYFVILGTIEPRKNHWMLLQIWRHMIERQADKAPRLVIIGQRGWECDEVVDLLERCEILKNFVIELPRCSDQELSTWLHHARALLFPSFAEGYGMPLIEALMQGLPAIASDLSAFREFAGNVPDYLDPLDGVRWRELIIDYAADDSPARSRQLQRLSRFDIPTWQSHFEQVEALMAQLDAGAP
ncbi:MAG: glycosyltransferase family 1 protein [Methylococcales bacterium]|nr:glycosyltransferase family 1 protein [Methylococcales bacterium]